MKGSILVPLDGSHTAEAALQFAGWIGDATGSPLLLFAVADGATAGSPVVPSELEQLDRMAAAVRTGSRTVATEVREGKAAGTIAARAAADDIGLVVLTTFGHSGDARHLGSVADRLARTIEKPALFVSPASDLPVPVAGPLLIGLDGSSTAETVLEPSVELAVQLGLPACLVRVAPWANELFAAFTGIIPPHADEEIELGSDTYLAALVERLPKSIDVEYQTLRGHAAAMLVEYAQNQAGILVMCSHGQSASHLWHLGSMTDKVLRLSSQPVLLIPAVRATHAGSISADARA